MKVEQVPPGSRLVDSLPFSQGGTAAQAQALKDSGVEGFVGYLGVLDATRLKHVLDAGLGFMPVTLASAYDGAAAVKQCKALGLPAGTTVWLDVEGMGAYKTPIGDLIAKINAWADAVASAGYVPGIYVGSPQPMTSDELYHLRVVRYWRAPARVVDRNGQLAEPSCGWCMYQCWPQRFWPDSGPGRVWVDVDFVSQDFKGRVPSWVKG